MQDAVLIPGLLCDAALWAAPMDALADTVRFAVADLAPDDEIGAMAEAVLADAPPRFAVAGFSMGSVVALEVFRRAPERVTRLALLSANYHKVQPNVAHHLSAAIDGIRAGEFDEYLEHAYPLYVAPDRIDDAELKATFKAMGHRQGPDAAIREIQALMNVGDYADLLPKIACPTAVVGGTLDQRTPPHLHREIAAAIPGAVLTLVDGSGHFTLLEKPEPTTAALATWLEG
jgi:pimeloyl-ACP methyl ester carboxylesterase